MGKKSDDIRINKWIRASTVRLISAEGKQLGIVVIKEALRIAQEAGMDLVEVSPNSDPPVCRIMDYGKFKYQAAKKAQDGRKKSRSVQMKEIKFRPNTEEHDLGFKVRNIKKFLEKKDRVKVSVFFRGREMAYMDAGYKLLKRVAEEVMEVGTMEEQPKQEARNRIAMVIVPR